MAAGKVSQRGSLTFLNITSNYEYNYKNVYTFNGINFNLGLLWNITESFTIGAVLKTPFSADLEIKSKSTETNSYPDNPDLDSSYTNTSKVDGQLYMPMSYGVGLSYRRTDRLSTSLDIYRTEWDGFTYTDSNGDKKSFLTGEDTNVIPTVQVRAGMEYLIIKTNYVIPLRSGLFYDPAPAVDNPEDFYGFSLGSGIVFKKVAFDAAYQHRFGNDVGNNMLQNLGFSQDINEHMLYFSTILYF